MSESLSQPEVCINAKSDSVKRQIFDTIKRKDLINFEKLKNLYKVDLTEELSQQGNLWTSIHYACYFDSLNILEILSKELYRVNSKGYISIINQKTKEGMTPLMISAMAGSTQTTEFLIRIGGIKLFEKDNASKTASQLAQKHKNYDIEKFLSKQMKAFLDPQPNPELTTPINLSELQSQPQFNVKYKSQEDNNKSVEDQIEFEELLLKGKRRPCSNCGENNGWLKFTTCCGQPIHVICYQKSNSEKCQNCDSENLQVTSELLYPERAFILEDEQLEIQQQQENTEQDLKQLKLEN